MVTSQIIGLTAWAVAALHAIEALHQRATYAFLPGVAACLIALAACAWPLLARRVARVACDTSAEGLSPGDCR